MPSSSSSNFSADGGLPKVEPLVISCSGSGTFLITTSGPALRVYSLPDGEIVSSKRAHHGTIVSLVQVPITVNHQQAVTCAKCATLVVWDVSRVLPLARVHIGSFLDLDPSAKHVPLGLRLSAGLRRKDTAPQLTGWVCMQTTKQQEDGSTKAVASVRSFPLSFHDLIRNNLDTFGSGSGAKAIQYRRLPKGAPKQGHFKVRIPGAFASSPSSDLVALADKRRAVLWRSNSKPSEPAILHHTKNFTCASVCGADENFAFGDEVGQVLVYYAKHAHAGLRAHSGGAHLSLRDATPSTFHWHAGPVLCLEWAPVPTHGTVDAVHLYSGGRECTLVVWELPVGKRTYLPRFPAPLVSLKACYATEAADDAGAASLLAVGCEDNSVVVVRVASKQRVCTIGGMQLPFDRVVSLRGKEVSLLSCRSGNVQRYSLDKDTQVAKFAVTHNHQHTASASALPGTGEGESLPLMVSYCAGEACMCTAEQPARGMNLWLKFWRAAPCGTKYDLERTVLNPHRGGVATLAGHPTGNTFVSGARDGSFKVWARRPAEVQCGQGSGEDGEWICVSSGFVPTGFLSHCCFIGMSGGDTMVGSFGAGNLGFWDMSKMAMVTALRCPPQFHVEEVTKVVLVPERRPTAVVATWTSKLPGRQKRSAEAKVGASVFDLLTLQHMWTTKFDAKCSLCCVPIGEKANAQGSMQRDGAFALSASVGPSTKVLFFHPASPRPFRVWHLNDTCRDLLQVDGEVAVATRAGAFISPAFAGRGEKRVQVVKAPADTFAHAQSKELVQAKQDLLDVLSTQRTRHTDRTEDATHGHGGATGGDELSGMFHTMLSRFNDVQSHVLPKPSELFANISSS